MGGDRIKSGFGESFRPYERIYSMTEKLYPRVDALIKTANECPASGFGIYPFLASNTLGFHIKEKTVIAVGYVHTLAEEKYFLFVDGASAKSWYGGKMTLPIQSQLIQFLYDFDAFEKRFYEYVKFAISVMDGRDVDDNEN